MARRTAMLEGVVLWLATIFLTASLLAVITVETYFLLLYFGAALSIKRSGGENPHELLPEDELPTLTVIVPLYKEGNMVAQLTEAIDKLKYPRDKLQVILALERTDAETIGALKTLKDAEVELDGEFPKLVKRGRTVFEVMYSKPGPKTKPNALNSVIGAARGEVICIFDAEDVPDPDQALKAISVLMSDDQLAAVQCKLMFYNRDVSFSTRLIQLEYTLWYEHLLPTLARAGFVTPLGGTSYYIRADALKKVGFWDAYNVTEDFELAFRLREHGYRVLVVDSYTAEEAPPKLSILLRQRTRWYKGYYQTFLKYFRKFPLLVRSIGLPRAVAALIHAASPLVGFFSLMAVALASVTRILEIEAAAGGFYRTISSFLSPISTAESYGLMIMSCLLFIATTGFKELAFLLTMPIAGYVIPVASTLALIELLTIPYYWYKTPHTPYYWYARRARLERYMPPPWEVRFSVR